VWQVWKTCESLIGVSEVPPPNEQRFSFVSPLGQHEEIRRVHHQVVAMRRSMRRDKSAFYG
jgi:hypothetical protein